MSSIENKQELAAGTAERRLSDYQRLVAYNLRVESLLCQAYRRLVDMGPQRPEEFRLLTAIADELGDLKVVGGPCGK